MRRQAEALGRLGEQEERAEAARQLLVGVVTGAVQVRALEPAPVQLGDAPRGDVDELVVRAELDRVRRAGFGAGRLEPVLEPVVAERALAGAPVDLVAVDDPKGQAGTQ